MRTRFLATLTAAVASVALLPPVTAFAATPIMGTQQVNGTGLAAWYATTDRQPHPDLKVSVRTLAELFVQEAAAEGVRGDIAFAQSVLETAYFSFPASGQVRPNDNNYGGIGAVDDGNTPDRFVTPREGIRAQIQHLRAYADPTVTKQNLAWPCVDPRFDLVHPKGTARTWEQLSGTWASDRDYGTKVLAIWGRILEYARPPAPPAGIPVSGDWNGDGRTTQGAFKDGVFYLRNRLGGGYSHAIVRLGKSGDLPVTGDWNGDGHDSVGVFRAGTWYLRNRNTTGPAQLRFVYGRAGDVPVTGDWNGNGYDTPGVVRGGTWHLRNRLVSGGTHVRFDWGQPTMTVMSGDWNGDGKDSPGLFRDGRWWLRDRLASGGTQYSFAYGRAGDVPLAGDWNRSGRATPLVFRRGAWYGRNALSGGGTTISFRWG